ncbi:hypothetical protein ACIGXG_17390 [Streptomyces goshikiensis]|uniref:hypothetical protein n=1 Tax=Streptomyces goshikiensis TaxID=1942 RepID=UPI0037D9106D
MSERSGALPSADGAEAESQALMFVRLWAEEVIRQTGRVQEIRERVRGYHRMHGDGPGIDSHFLEEAFREQWAAEHTLLWAAYQLERWRKRLDRERGETERKYDAKLLGARNVLEHLDSADFRDGKAVAPPWSPPAQPKKRKPQDPYRSLRALDGLYIGTSDDGSFCGIASSELSDRALDVVKSVEADLAEEAVAHLIELGRGR